MFKLQRLEITGFKSFADYTEIVFTGSGITAVVGPNGCGKSNVSDSIAWVLGEQKAKSLRGEEMKDVVFQGTNKRKPSGMAEVVLHLVRDESSFDSGENELEDIDQTINEIDKKVVDLAGFEDNDAEFESSENKLLEEIETENSKAAQVGSIQTVQTKIKTKRHWRSRSFALDFMPGEAVSVARRLYLSGESEYLLNGKSCRLRDVQDLFAGTGLSGSHYALIEQGKIGQILSSKPSDRRNLIEEAAGVSKFRTRQRAAEARLEAAKINLSRISDIVSEIEKQTNNLRRQAAKTQRYKALREEFRQSLRKIFAAEGRQLSERVAELEENLKKAIAAERGIFWEVAEKDEAFREATQKAREAEENLSLLRARHSENALERDRNLREIGYQTEQINNLNQRRAALESEVKSAEARLKLVKNEIQRLQKEEQKERAEAEKHELDLRSAENKYQIKLRELNQSETALEVIRADVLQHTTAFERLSGVARQLKNTSERLGERAIGLHREGERAEESYIEHKNAAEKIEKILVREREKLHLLHAEKQGILEETSDARNDLHKNEKALESVREKFSRNKHRLETLQELEEKHAVYEPSVQKLFAEQDKIGVKFCGTLADELDVDEKVEKAIENLFGVYLQTVLVENEKDAQKIIRYLRENNLGRISILIKNSKIKVQNSESKIQNLKSKVQSSQIKGFLGTSKEFAELLEETFPREMTAQLIENFDRAENKVDKMFINFDGDLSFGGKFFVVGKQNANEKNNSLLAFKRELRELKTVCQKLQKDIQKAENEANKTRRILAEKENKLVDLQSFIVKIERELISQEMQAKSFAQETERAERHKKIVVEEHQQIQNELAEIRTKEKEAQVNADKAGKARIESSKNLAELTIRLNNARAQSEIEINVLNEKRTLSATSNERRRSVQTALKQIENELSEINSRLARQNLEMIETKQKADGLTNLITQAKSRNSQAENELEDEQNELLEVSVHLKIAREHQDSMSAELAELNKKSAEARNERAALEIKQAEIVARLKNLNEKCSEDLNLSLIELIENEETQPDFDLQTARQATGDLRRKLENFGAINMLALEELSKTEERLLFLTSQRQDIIDSIGAAEEALREIKERSREKFRAAFEAINRNFTEFFQELFGGGRGEMTLLEAEDLLEAGIEITAQPPGKRLQNILLLSGGEKAMTAIALVMAIFQYRPAPFCLLDEVDAPLDDANVGRFVNKIAVMSEKTQFIVITHNKRTMEAAKALYGVTMQEAGISKVVSVRFE